LRLPCIPAYDAAPSDERRSSAFAPDGSAIAVAGLAE